MSDEDNNEANQEVDAADEGHYVARCRGLPWSTTVEEIKNFFSKCRFKEGTSFSSCFQSHPFQFTFDCRNYSTITTIDI